MFKRLTNLLAWMWVFILISGGSHVLPGQQTTYPIDEMYRNEILDVASESSVQKAFEYIASNDDWTVLQHIRLTEIPAPPFKETERAIAFQKLLAGCGGLDSLWIDEVGNVLALRKGFSSKKTIALDAHLDTVFPEGTDVSVEQRGDTLYAPGIGDDTRGLAMLAMVLKAMNAVDLRTEADVLFVGSVGEEGLGDLRGVKHLFRKGAPDIDAWIAIDGGQIGRINNQALGSYRFRVTFEGPGGHSWGAFGLANPHHALARAVDQFVQVADAYTLDGPRTSYNIGRVGGGTSVNSIPFESWMEVDVRSIDPGRLDTLETMLRMAVEAGVADQNRKKRRGAAMTYRIEMIGNRPSGELSPSLPLIQRAMAATAYFGKRPRLTRGSTNSNIPISMDIPAVTIGRGGTGAGAHSLDEWWMNKDGAQAIQLALLLVLAEAGLAD